MESPAIVGVPDVKGLRIRVGDIVSPAHLWISPSTYDLEQSRTILKPLLDAGPRLSNLFATDSDPTHYDTDDDIQTGLVAVRAQTKSNGEVYRGRVIRRYTRRNESLCDAFLIDIGETWTDLDVRMQIRVIRDPRLIQIEPMAESVYLYGLAPTSQDLDYSLPPSQSLVRTLASQWNQMALNLVTKIVRSGTELRLNLISQPRAETSDSLSGDIYFSIRAVSDRRAILASVQRNCPGILAHFFRSDDYYSLRQLLLTLNFCVDLGDSLPKTKLQKSGDKTGYFWQKLGDNRSNSSGSTVPKLPASVPNTRVDPNSEMDAQDSNPIEYDVVPSQQDRSTLEDWITTKKLDVEEDIWDDMNEITQDDDFLFSQDQGEHEVAESSLVASKTSSRGRGDRRKRAALELSKTSNDSEERPGKQASIQKPQIQDLSQAWSQVRKELPKTSRSPAGTRMAGGVDVGKFIQGLQEKMNAKKNEPSQSDDEVSSFYDAQSQFEGESESERFSSCLDKFAIPERTEPDGCKSHDSSVASSKVIPTTPDFPQPTAPISPSQRLAAQDESAPSELDLNLSQSSHASSKPSTGLSLLKSRFREKKLFKTSPGPESPAISKNPPSVEISFDVPLDVDLETRLPDPLVTNPADVSYPWETIVHNPLNARRKSVPPCQNAADIRKWSREFVMCLDQARMATPTGIQKVMWPLLVDLKSVVAIGKKEVATCGYLIPLIYSLSNNKKEYPAPAEGPSCVILCPSHSVVERVWKTLKWLTQDVLFVRDEILVNVVFENEHKLTALLANGCDVLITTPPSILKCVEEIKSTNFMRCCHLVFEESDLIFEEFQTEVLAIMEHARAALVKNDELFGQTILTSERWMASVGAFLAKFFLDRNLVGPTICVGNPMEAAIYGRITHIASLFKDKEYKLRALVDIVSKYRGKPGKTLLINCQNAVTAAQVKAHLLSQLQLKSWVIDESMKNEHELNEVLENWAQVQMGQATLYPLIVTDLAGSQSSGFANVVIHFDVATSKERLRHRFWYLSDYFGNFYQSQDDPKAKKSHATVHMMLTPSNVNEINTLFQFLKRSSRNRVPKSLSEFYLKVMSNRAKKKMHRSLCQELKALGRCKELWRCPYRHYLLKEVDFDGNPFPRASIIYFEVTQVLSPIRNLVKIKQIQESGAKKRQDFIANPSKLSRKLFLLKRAQLEIIPDIKILVESDTLKHGQLFLMEDEGFFQRIEVLSFRSPNEFSLALQIWLVDDGLIQERIDPLMFKLPDEYSEAHYPRQSHELILANLKPPLKNLEWPLDAINLSEDRLYPPEILHYEDGDEEFDGNAKICRSKVILGLRKMVWVKQIQLLEKFTANLKWSCVGEMRDTLLKKNLAIQETELTEKLDQLCFKAGIPGPILDYNADNEKQSKKPKLISEHPLVLRWAFFPTASEVVLITHVNSPDYFHVTLEKFSKQLDQLELDLKKLVDDKKVKAIQEGSPEVEKVFIHRDNEICARVQVLDNANESKVLVLFVDSGLCKLVKVEDLFPIPRNLVEILPFQAIECAFNNILPLNEDWDRSASEYLRQQIFLKETLLPQPFFLIPFLKGESDYTDCNQYLVSMTSTISHKVLENRLVSKGWAQFEDEMRKLPDFSNFDDAVEGEEEANSDAIDEALFQRRIDPEEFDSDEVDILPPKIMERQTKAKTSGFPELSGLLGPDSWRPLPTLELTPDLPSLAVSQGEFQTKLPALVLWSQDRTDVLVLKVNLQLDGKLHENNVFVQIHPQSVEFSYLEVILGQEPRLDEYVVHKFPQALHLFGVVDPDKSELSFGSTSIMLTLKKTVMCSWKCLATLDGKKVSYSWLKSDLDHFDTDSEDDGSEGEHRMRAQKSEPELEPAQSIPQEPIKIKTSEDIDQVYGHDLKPAGYSSDEPRRSSSKSMSEESEADGFGPTIPLPMRKRPLEQNPDRY